MWCVLWLLGVAMGTELAFQFETGEGIEETWIKEHSGSYTARFGPVEGRGKRSVRYDITVPASVFDPLKNGFETRVTVCRYWYKGSKRDRDCLEDLMLVPSEAEGPLWVGGKIKGTDKFFIRIGAFYQGTPPTALGLPGEEPVVAEPEPEPEVVEVVEEEPAEPAKDEMTSALEDIASQVVTTLGESDDDEEDDDEEDGDDDGDGDGDDDDE